MKRVAVVAYHSSPLEEPGIGDAGGMTVYVRAVGRALAARGLETDVFTRSNSADAQIAQIGPGVSVIALPAGPPRAVDKDDLAEFVDDFASAVADFGERSGRGYDVVHSHYWQSGMVGRRLATRWDLPWVHSQHTLARVKDSFRPTGERAESPRRIAGEIEVISAADVLIASTEEEADHLTVLYGAPAGAVKTIYPGVDQTLFSPGDRARARVLVRAALGVDPEAALLVSIGRIQPLKGLELAIETLEQLTPALERPVELVIVGGASGPSGAEYTGALEKRAEAAGLRHRVHLVGPKPHEATVDFYRSADAVLVCSYSESFGLTALEAQACGIPVVGTDVGGLAHVVRDGSSGFLVSDRDPAVVAGFAKTLLSDQTLWSDFSRTARAAAWSFTWERTARELLELYECLIERRAPEACTC
ncbi:MAG: glycosyltransferase [Actinomycetota bacterium]|nr:glycosyltransferase [Actinomycetota bacterium]